MQYYTNFDLTNYNSFHIKSIAKEIYFPENIIDLEDLLLTLTNFYILSEGTNVLLNSEIDKVICLKLMPRTIEWHRNKCIVDANVLTNYFIQEVLHHDYNGVEGLLGIPGSMGGTVVMNAGSGNYAISDCLTEVYTVDYQNNGHTYTKKDLQFNRRYSILQDKKEIVVWVLFEFNKKGINQKVINQTLEYRKNFPKGFSAGGIFKNWYDLKSYEKEIRAIQSNNISISSMLNVLINNGKTTTEELLNFINQIKSIVKKPLELEIKLIGIDL
jgi:UDP-N-acetylmuramate dehydrogenase